MDKDILARTMAQLRRGVVHKQVALGREFKGCPFNSKPQLVHFQDFEVGKAYKKKITLVNATYTINYCSLVGVSEDLRDFIHVSFDPPGPLSAGMSCEVLVTFKPMVSLDKELISFGSYVVGETTSRTITLTNTGGLGTSFKFLPASEVYETDEESLPLLKMSSLFTYDDKGPTSVSEQQLEGNGTSPLDTQSRKESDKMEGEGTCRWLGTTHPTLDPASTPTLPRTGRGEGQEGHSELSVQQAGQLCVDHRPRAREREGVE
ncbi:Hypothetical predicted protein [Marmota monax]|uniref:Abnormal spindle-like microcephaly-associated protein ASH domain-containing protein n=1 Tax=Marmota monax TaxID=9995 RepID=A0A5E4DCR5_MARMO|nr:Hypothetical predicted protein [Marmota monax]